MTDTAKDFDKTGQVWFRAALPEEPLNQLETWADVANRPGQRINAPMPRQAVDAVTTLVGKVLPGAVLVRAVAFNKAGETNWSVPWHQDRVIAVADRVDLAGFRNWSCKDGVWHCEPPMEFLQLMVFARLHLDAADHANGCMEIAPGSHRLGMIPAVDAHDVASRMGSEPCIAARGDLQILKMLTLHRSRPATDPRPRRAVRLDFVATTLPKGLRFSDWDLDAAAN